MSSPQSMTVVGQYNSRFNELTGESLPCGPIYQSAGLVKHVQSHHPNEVENVALIPDIIRCPDYVGHNPNEPNSIELVKIYENNVMVCIKLDVQENYLFVATVFDLKPVKLKNRLHSGRLKKY